MSPMLMRSCVLARVIQPPCKNVPTSASLPCYAALRSMLPSKTTPYAYHSTLEQELKPKPMSARYQCLLLLPTGTAISTLLSENRHYSEMTVGREFEFCQRKTPSSSYSGKNARSEKWRGRKMARCHHSELLLRAPPCRPPPS